MSLKTKPRWLSMDQIMNNLTEPQKIREIEKKTRYYTQKREDYRMKDKESVADNIMDGLSMKGTQREEVEKMIKHDYPNLKLLLNNYSEQVVIACICFFVLSSYNKNVRIEDYRVLTRLSINYRVYSKFLTNLLVEARKLMKIKPRLEI